jgi:uncharacterized protein
LLRAFRPAGIHEAEMTADRHWRDPNAVAAKRSATAVPEPGDRARSLITTLGLQPHPEGGWYREVFRSARQVMPEDGRPSRAALTHIDFLLTRGQMSAWHRVRSDEVWQRLEGSALRLWLLPPSLDRLHGVTLADLGTPLPDGLAAAAAGAAAGGRPVESAAMVVTPCAPRHVVPAHWWQAAEPLGDFAYVGATVGPGFDFADFSFGRDDAALPAALDRLAPALRRCL